MAIHVRSEVLREDLAATIAAIAYTAAATGGRSPRRCAISAWLCGGAGGRGGGAAYRSGIGGGVGPATTCGAWRCDHERLSDGHAGDDAKRGRGRGIHGGPDCGDVDGAEVAAIVAPRHGPGRQLDSFVVSLGLGESPERVEALAGALALAAGAESCPAACEGGRLLQLPNLRRNVSLCGRAGWKCCRRRRTRPYVWASRRVGGRSGATWPMSVTRMLSSVAQPAAVRVCWLSD